MSLSVLYCSDEFRAIESAQIIASTCGVPLNILKGMEERNWGEFSGKPFSEVKKVLDPLTLDERYTYVPTKGESWKDAENRLISCVRSVIETNSGRVIGIVTHGGSIRILMPYLLGAPIEETFKHDPKNASLSIFSIEGGKTTAVSLDDVAHLSD